MSRKRSTIEWQICEDERDWQSARTLFVSNNMPGVRQQRWPLQRVLRWGLPSLLCMLLLGGVVGGWLWYRAQAGLDEIAAELRAVVVAEVWSAQGTTSTPTASRNGIAPQGRHHEQVTLNAWPIAAGAELDEKVIGIDIRDLGEDWAVVEVLIQPLAAGPSYRQTRIYRGGVLGWKRTEVTAEYWGSERQLESSYFVFDYYARDHEAVTQAAVQLDTLYPALVGSFFIDMPLAEKAVIRVDPEWEPGELPPQSAPPGAMVVASPAATLAPADLALSDLLLQSVMLALFDRLAEQATTQYDLPRNWLPLRDGMRLWFIWEQQLPLSKWREPLVKWVFWDTQRVVTQRASSVPEFAHELCAHHLLWTRKPLFDVGVPITCPLQSADEKSLVAWRYIEPLMKIPLPPLIGTSMYLQDPKELLTTLPPAGVALATIFEYAATTFGAERLPMLLAALPQHGGWDTLIPAVFGLSLEEFESGWRAFLEERYGIKP